MVGRHGAAFAQIGDGAIVILDGTEYRPVFWPQSGEYHNFTFFLTDPRFERNVQCEVLSRPVDEVALFSDGLQMLALRYETKTAHQPFFVPIFTALRRTAEHEGLIVPMRQFLDSPGVNDRTDDDKTLVLATRLAASSGDSGPDADATAVGEKTNLGIEEAAEGNGDAIV